MNSSLRKQQINTIDLTTQGRFIIKEQKDNTAQQVIVLEIKGMTCASCVNRIEKVLKKNEGIVSVSVNLATEKAKVEYEGSKVDVSKIISLITMADYEAKTSADSK